MIDMHTIPDNWGLCSTIFGISSYSFFVLLGIILGCIYFLYSIKEKNSNKENTAIIFTAALVGSSIGSKLPIIIANYKIFFEKPALFLSGRSILGGFIGGLAGVLIIKKVLKVKGKYGNNIAPAAALGIAVGRIGCLMKGCCYGKIGSFGIDFGDGNLRYPTQIFEIIFHLIAFLLLNHYKNKIQRQGILFTYYVISYFIFRFFTEFIRESQIVYLNLTLYQIISILGIIMMKIKITFQKKEIDIKE